MNRFPVLTVALACLLISSSAVAQVYRSDSGLGSALILPYWTVAAGNDTLIGISNDSARATALKLRLLDEQGELLDHFNLYLNARSQWGAAVTRVDGQSLLLPSELGCLFPPPSASHDDRPAVALDAPRGSVEIIEMGSVSMDSELVLEGRWTDCGALADAFDTGPWADDPNADLEPPTHRISAQVTLINVAAGGMNTVPATVIGGFSDIAQHTAPESALPDLAHAFDSGAGHGGVRSLVCVAGGCRTDEWARPIEAVAAVLMVTTKTVGYSVDPDLAARFEWLLHRPLKRYESEVEDFSIGSAPTISSLPPSGLAPPQVNPGICITPSPGFACNAPPPLRGSQIQDSLPFDASMDDYAQIIDSSILGHPALVWPGFAFGGGPSILGAGSSVIELGGHDEPLTAPDGARFLGEPLISFAIQQFSNGTLTDDQGQNVLSNYRRTELPRQTLRLQAPE